MELEKKIEKLHNDLSEKVEAFKLREENRVKEITERGDAIKAQADAHRLEIATLNIEHERKIDTLRNKHHEEIQELNKEKDDVWKRRYEEGRKDAISGYRLRVTPFTEAKKFGIPGIKKYHVKSGTRMQLFHDHLPMLQPFEFVDKEYTATKIDPNELLKTAVEMAKLGVAVYTGNPAFLIDMQPPQIMTE